jgi:hypothetical protein
VHQLAGLADPLATDDAQLGGSVSARASKYRLC